MSTVTSWGRNGWGWVGWALLLALLGLARPASAETPREVGVQRAPQPTWVSPLQLEGLEAPAASGGITVLAVQLEARFVRGTGERYFRRVIRVVSEAGVRLAGEQRFAFTPPYQRLLLHAIQIRRAGQAISALTVDKLRILQRETQMDAGVYSGERTAVALLEDVRVGDELDCEYSIVGQNPVLDGHVMQRWQLRFPSAIGLLKYRALTDHAVTTVAFGNAPTPQVAQVGPLHEYTFTGLHLPEAPLEEARPPEYDPFPWLQVTDFASWAEVAAWGSRLFERPAPSANLVDVAKKISEHEQTNELRVVALLRFVQDRIRYTSLAFAEGSHRPNDPDLVLKRGFGDCKDKSLLLVKLLQAIGVRAWPALVASYGGERVDTLMPTIDAFDHVIVALELEGKRYFVDPTRQHQRGGLQNVSDQPYGRALLLGGGDGKLVDVPRPSMPPELGARLRYDVSSYDAPVKLVSNVLYRGSRAEALRALLAESSETEYNKALQAVVTASHHDAEPVGTPFVRDNEVENSIEVQQEYRLRSPWLNGPRGQHVLPLFPPWLRGEMTPPAPGRMSPLWVAFPREIVHDIEVHLPDERNPYEKSQGVDAGPYHIDYTEKQDGHRTTLHLDFQTRRRRVEPNELVAYRDELDRAGKFLDLSIGPVQHFPPAFSTNAVWVMGVLWTLALLVVVVLVQRHQPYLKLRHVARDPRLARRGGWLWLVAVGVTLAPLTSLQNVKTVAGLFEEPTWSALTSRESPVYRAWFAPVTTLQLLLSLFVLVWGCYCTYLFWANRRTFPLAFIIELGQSGCLLVADHVIAALLRKQDAPGDDMQTFEVIVRVVISGMWIGYLLQSRRVASLFAPREPGDERDESGAAAGEETAA